MVVTPSALAKPHRPSTYLAFAHVKQKQFLQEELEGGRARSPLFPWFWKPGHQLWCLPLPIPTNTRGFWDPI